jgi:RHS repeat-associated protein
LGANWNESFDIKLYTTLDGSQAIIKEGDGTLDHFTYSNGVYSAETGLFITLQKLGDNTWKATTKDNIQYSFDSSLKLYKITDLNGNYLQYAYNPNGTINTITSSANEVLSFAYYTASDNSGAWTGLLKSITLPTISTDSTQRVFNYSYNSNKQLISRSSILSDSRNWMEQFGYNASGLLSSVTDGNGNQTSLQYDVNNRVNQVNYPTVNNYTEYLQYIYNISSTSVKNQLGQGSTYYYDINGLVSKTTDALGHDTNYIYDTSKYLVTQEYYYNFINGINTLITWNYAYDSKGNLTTSIDPLGHYTCYEYNSLNEITFKHVKNTDNVTDFAETQYQYDNIGNLTTEIEPDLDKTVYTYNGFGLVATESSFPYYANAQGGYMLAPRTSVTYTYDPIHHWLIQTTKPSGLSTKTLKFDGLGNPIYLEDENGNISKTGYDSLGDDIIDYQAISGVSESNPDSANWSSDPKTSNSYDLDGNTTKSISETGLETDNYYDALNRVFKTIVDPTGKNAISTEAYSYDSNGNYIDTSTDLTTGIVNSDYYNALNQEVKSVSSDSTTTYICDNVGNRIDSSTSTVGDNVINETINKFDVLGRITDTYEDAMASDIHSTMLYDILSNVTERNDGKGSDTLSVYNNNSKLQSEILSKNGNQYTTTYLYNVSDGSGNTYNSITDDNGTQQTYFNSDGDEIKEIDALSNGTTYTTLFNNSNSSSPTEDVYVGSSNQRDLSHNQYDTSAGTNNLVLSQMPASQSVSCAYNPVNVPQTEKYESDSIDRYVYAYDVFGNLKNVKDNINSLETNYTYDGANRLSTVVEGPIGLLNPTHTYSIGYSNGNISTISESINGQSLGTNYTYYDNNNLKTTAFSYGSNSTSKTEWLYDDYNRMSTQNVYDDSTNKIFSTSILYTENSNDTSYISSVENKQVTQNGFDKTLTYGYNNNAIKSITSVWDGTNLITYSYDDRERLIRENNQGAGKTWTWEYYQDGTTHGGNIHYKREYSYTTNDDPGTPSSTITYAYNDSQGWTDLLTSYNGNAITYYSGSGNPQSDGIWTYSWEAGHNLIGLSKTGTNVSFTYNQDGIRTSKAINNITTKYTLVNGCVTSATTGTNVVYFRYDSNGSPISMETGGIEYYYFKDAQSDIIGMFDHNGNVVVQYTYDAWGKLLSETDGNGNDKMSDPNFIGNTNPYRYRGYWYDEYDYSSGFGLYYLQSRYYNPLWDRFINADTADNANDNMFSYCRNNPVTNVDPTGEGSVTTAGLYRFISIHDDLPDSTTKSYTTHYGDDCYGGDQQWYMPDKFKVSHGCGSVAAANITCYYAQYYSSLSKLYKYSTLNASDFKKHMLDVYKYVGWPWSITDVLNGLKTFGKTRGVKFGINNAGASSSATLDQSVAFIENGLNSDNPVILLTEKIYNNYDQIPQWHYMTITAIQDDTSTSTRKVTIAVSSWGLCYYFDYICLYNGTHKHGPLHYSGTGFLSRP